MEQYEELNIPVQEQEKESKLDIGRFLRRIRKYFYIVIATVIIGTVIGYRQAQKIVPVYQASALIRDKAALAGSEGVLNENRVTELQSRTFAERVVAQLGLTLHLIGKDGDHTRANIFEDFYTTQTPTVGRYRLVLDDRERYYLYFFQGTDSTVIDSSHMAVVVDSCRSINGFSFRLNPGNVKLPMTVNFKIRPFDSEVARLRSQTKITFKSSEGANSKEFMRISLTDTDQDMVAAKVNRLAELYIQESSGMQARDDRKRDEALKQKLDAAKQKLDDSETALRAFKQAHPEGVNEKARDLIKTISNLESALQEIPINKKGLLNLLNKLEDARQSEDADETLKYIYSQICNYKDLANDTEIGILKEQIKDLLTRYDRFIETVSESHQDAQKLKDKINQLYANIEQIANQYLETLSEQERNYRNRIEEARSVLKTLPGEHEQQAELERELSINEELYSSLLVKFQQTQISDAVVSEYLDILEPAIRPKDPDSPGKKNVILVALIIGLVAGLAIPIGIEVMDQHIYSEDDIKKHLKLKVLGVIPNIDFKDVPDFHDSEKAKRIDRQLVTHNYTPTPIGEAYRALRTNLMFSKNIGKIRTLVITSTAPEEGKSFTSSNFSIILAQQRTNTLLVDADLRRGVLHNTFNCQKFPGFSNYLTNTVTLAEVVQETHIPNLSFISCGDLLPNPSELLGSLQMRRFLDEVRRKFDLVIFDSPPLNAATDAIVIGAQVDALVVVVRAGHTNRKQAKLKLEIFDTVPVNLIGVILNGKEAEPVRDTYSYYHY